MRDAISIIKELEDEYNIEIDNDFDAGADGLCDGDICRHSECDCWDNFESAVRGQLEKQVGERIERMSYMKILADAEKAEGYMWRIYRTVSNRPLFDSEEIQQFAEALFDTVANATNDFQKKVNDVQRVQNR